MSLRTGAVIVAAGLSLRMGTFKPLLKFGSVTIAQQIIITLHQAGASPVVVVAGYNADMFEKHVSHMGAVCLRNEHYADSQMLDSAKIGLAFIQRHCDRVLFTPVDIPLFTNNTIKMLLAEDGPVALPVYEGIEGHPLLISSVLIPSILDYSGDNGLEGAIKSCGKEKRLVPVKDDGVLFDVDTPEDYQELMHRHTKNTCE